MRNICHACGRIWEVEGGVSIPISSAKKEVCKTGCEIEPIKKYMIEKEVEAYSQANWAERKD